MTKQEAIKQAYGEHWNEVKDYVDENGYANLDYSFTYEDIGLELQENGNWRPKSIQGIETNNGWIKIESEKDLPTERDMNDTLVIDKNGIMETVSSNTLKWVYSRNHWINYYTHYQTIAKPKPPIY